MKSDEDRYVRQLIENLQRRDLAPMERARSLQEYKKKLGDKDWTEVERLTGISRRRRQQYLALFKLPQYIKDEIMGMGKEKLKSQITEKHARALLLLNKMEKEQKELFERIKATKNPVSGNEAIKIVKEIKKKARDKAKDSSIVIYYKDDAQLLKKLEAEIEKVRRRLKNAS